MQHVSSLVLESGKMEMLWMVQPHEILIEIFSELGLQQFDTV